MFCGKCGKPNTEGVEFCVHCGANLKRQTPGGASGDTLDRAATRPAGELCVGHVLAGRYRIEERLGSGGMGEVWKATDTELNDLSVAIKVLPAALARSTHSVNGLRREAAIALKLTDDRICRLHTFHSDGDVKFLVMEYLAGRTLDEMLDERRERKLSLEELLPIARDVAAALDFAHGKSYTDAAGHAVKGILHRDIKPSNIMVMMDAAGAMHAKVLDFGIAREMKDSMTRVTGKETSGTLLYMSPEQYSGQTPTAASDVYSFAATLYECLCGHPPFHQGSIGHQLLHLPAPRIEGGRDHVNEALQAGLAKTAADRPATASKLVELLTRKSEETPPSIREAPEPNREQPFPAASSPTTELRRGGVVVAAILVALAGLLIYAGMKGDQSGAARSGETSGTSQPSTARVAVSPVPSATAQPSPPPVTKSEPPKKEKPKKPEPTREPKREEPNNPQPPQPSSDLPKTLTLDCGTGVKLELVLIPAGTFTMGSNDGSDDEKPPHNVTISQPFYMGQYEVTQKQWQAVMKKNPSNFQGDDLPVERVSRDDCQEFCKTLSANTDKMVRLPTEAEWEYGCRADSKNKYCFGNDYSVLGEYAWCFKNARAQTHPIGEKRPNSWGLYDMHGNVFEWCEDVYHDNYDGAPLDGSAWTTEGRTSNVGVLRGGSSISVDLEYLRSAARWFAHAHSRVDFAGFRVVISLSAAGTVLEAARPSKAKLEEELTDARGAVDLADKALEEFRAAGESDVPIIPSEAQLAAACQGDGNLKQAMEQRGAKARDFHRVLTTAMSESQTPLTTMLAVIDQFSSDVKKQLGEQTDSSIRHELESIAVDLRDCREEARQFSQSWDEVAPKIAGWRPDSPTDVLLEYQRKVEDLVRGLHQKSGTLLKAAVAKSDAIGQGGTEMTKRRIIQNALMNLAHSCDEARTEWIVAASGVVPANNAELKASLVAIHDLTARIDEGRERHRQQLMQLLAKDDARNRAERLRQLENAKAEAESRASRAEILLDSFRPTGP